MPRYARPRKRKRYTRRYYRRRFRRKSRAFRNVKNHRKRARSSAITKYLGSKPYRLQGPLKNFTGLPAYQRRVLTSFKSFGVSGTGILDLKQFHLNDLVNQYNDSNSTTPIGYDDFSNIYHCYSVTSCVIKWRMRRDTYMSDTTQATPGLFSCMFVNDNTTAQGSLTYSQARNQFYKLNFLPPLGPQFNTAHQGYGYHGKSKWKSIFVDVRRFINDEVVDKASENKDMLTLNSCKFADDGTADQGPQTKVVAHMHVYDEDGAVVGVGKQFFVDMYISTNVILFQPKT